MKKMILFSMIAFLLIACSVMADSTQQYNKVYLNPFYRVSMSGGTIYIYNVSVTPPDNIANVVSAIIGFNAQVNGQSQNFTLLVNGIACNPSSYYVATAFSTTGNVQFYFDCSNVIKKSGFYNVSLVPTVNTGALTGWLELTYMNNPLQKLSVGGTEYTVGQSGKIFVEFLNTNGTPINNGTCFLTAYKPDSSVLYNAVSMTSVGSNGLYYYDIATVPSTTGVYMVSVYCLLPRLSSNSTISLTQDDSFSNITSIWGGSGFADNWELYGVKVYDSSTEPEYSGEWNNFVAFAGGTASGNFTSSYLINKNSSVSFNQLDWRLQNIYGNPANDNWVYNISICPTTKGNLTSNATVGADCEGAITTLVNNANISAFMDNKLYDRRYIPFQDYTMNSSKHYVIMVNFVSSNISGSNSFWNDYASSFFVSNQFRRVINGTVSLWAVILDMRLYLSNATIINSGSCYSGSCLRLADNSYAMREFDASNSNGVNITFYARMINQQVGDSAELDYYDGTWHTIKTWNFGDLTSWSYQTVKVGSYQFGANKIMFQVHSANGSTVQLLIDNLQIYQDVVSYYQDNATTYVTARGGSEMHISSPNTTATINASDVWNYNNRTLTDYNQSGINGQLTAINNNVLSTNGTVNYWGNLLSGMMTSVNNTLNAWGNSITFLLNSIPDFVWNYTSRNLTYYPPAVNITNYTINLTTQNVSVANYTLNLTVLNQTVNVTDYLLNLTNYTINVTNQTVEVVNQTLNLTVLNQTVNVTNETLNLTVLNQTVEVINQTLNLTVLNQTVEVANYTLNVTQPIINLTNYTINVSNETYNYNYTYNYTNPLNLTVLNQTVNVTVLNQTVNVTDYLLNLTNYTINVTNVTNNVTVINTTVDTGGIAENVWNYPVRNMTFYPPAVNMTNVTLNITNQTVEVVNQTLNLTVLNQTVNVTDYLLNLTNYTVSTQIVNVTNETLILTILNTTVNPAEVWNYTNRTLTDYNQTGIFNAFQSLANLINSIFDYETMAEFVWNYTARYTHGWIFT